MAQSNAIPSSEAAAIQFCVALCPLFGKFQCTPLFHELGTLLLRAWLVSEWVRVLLGASVPEKAVGTELSDGPPVFGRFSVAQRRVAREV
jgi:hypothetical protein